MLSQWNRRDLRPCRVIGTSGTAWWSGSSAILVACHGASRLQIFELCYLSFIRLYLFAELSLISLVVDLLRQKFIFHEESLVFFHSFNLMHIHNIVFYMLTLGFEFSILVYTQFLSFMQVSKEEKWAGNFQLSHNTKPP